jgi:hypothetical protein
MAQFSVNADSRPENMPLLCRWRKASGHDATGAKANTMTL